ncbi:MAG: flagellar FliJ family protein [Rhodospirillales bacterium]|nr:flagellar FliJ family protein [Alphaproteobacteria bacterium]USO02928.1 MAG: flagellar FliJ family protein [Rhodospirillales bacterium]
MGSDLSAIVRLRRHSVEEKQKMLADLYRQVETFEVRKNQLLKSLQKEREALEKTEDLAMLGYFGTFSEAVESDIERLEEELAKLEVRVRIAQDDMREAFANLKRVEIVQRNRREEEKKEIGARETKEMDDIGIEGFRRKE